MQPDCNKQCRTLNTTTDRAPACSIQCYSERRSGHNRFRNEGDIIRMLGTHTFTGDFVVDDNVLSTVVTSCEHIFDAGNMLFADDPFPNPFRFISSVGKIQAVHSYGNFKMIYGQDDHCCF